MQMGVDVHYSISQNSPKAETTEWPSVDGCIHKMDNHTME